MREAFQSKIIEQQSIIMKDVTSDGVRVRQLEKELRAVKSIAKVNKHQVAKLEKDIEKLNGFLAEYNATIRRCNNADERIKGLLREVDQLKQT